MAPKGKVLNIEIGDRLTKVCVSVPRGKSYQIRDCFMFQCPDGAVSDGQINAPDALAARLTEELVAHGLTDVKTVIFSLSSGKIATREITLPPMKDNRLAEVVQSNASDYFPIDLSKYHVTHCLLERVDKGENAGCRVLVFAAPLSLLETYFALAREAALSIRAIDFSGNSQYQALRTIGGEAVTMYVNVDCNSSCATFMQGGKLLLQRTFAFGGDDFVLAFMNAGDRGALDYVAALQACSAEEPELVKVGAVTFSDAADSLARLVGNVSRSSDYFNTNHWDQPLEKVVLMGPCSKVYGLRDMIAGGTGLETAYLDDLPGIAAFANAVETASLYISCIGSSIAPLDLIPPQFKADSKKRKNVREKTDSQHIRDGIIICAVCLIAAAALSGFALFRYNAALDEKTAMEEEIASLQYTKTVYDAYVASQAGADALTELDASIASPNDSLTAFIGELEEKMPAEILVLSATCTRENISMNVTVPTFGEVAVVLTQLRTFETIANITVSSVTETVDEAGVSTVAFSVTCDYKTDAADGTAVAAAGEG